MSVNDSGVLSDFMQAGHLSSLSTLGTSNVTRQDQADGPEIGDFACHPCLTFCLSVSQSVSQSEHRNETALQLAENSEIGLSSTRRQKFP
jgi:hypothetical protein